MQAPAEIDFISSGSFLVTHEEYNPMVVYTQHGEWGLALSSGIFLKEVICAGEFDNGGPMLECACSYARGGVLNPIYVLFKVQ